MRASEGGRTAKGPRALAGVLFALLLAACVHAPPFAASAGPPARVRLLTLNDFHGQLGPGQVVGSRPVGSAGVLGSWLTSAFKGESGRTVLVEAGDLVGASPPTSALLLDEPAVSFVNRFADPACRYIGTKDLPRPLGEPVPLPEVDASFLAWLDPACDVVGVVGNHEFDRGEAELLRLVLGGTHPRGPFLESPWRGARYPTLAANVVDRATGRPILPPFVVKRVDGVEIGFIGVVTREVPSLVTPTGVAGLEFLDEAETVNRYAALLRRQGVRALVVLLHQGGDEPPYVGPTREGGTVEGEVVDIVARLDPGVDVVVAGHTHDFVNARLPARDGKKVLVVEAFYAGSAFGWIDLEVDRRSGEVVSSQAEVQTAWADEGPGLTPDRASQAIQAAAEAKVRPMVNRVVALAARRIRRAPGEGGQSELGELVADAQRAAFPGAQIAFTNPGGLRADLEEGPLTFGDLFAAQPFGNALVAMTLTGEEILRLLEEQWERAKPMVLEVSGLTYGFSESAVGGAKVRDVRVGGVPLDRKGRYRVVVNAFLSSGGDGFTELMGGSDRGTGVSDLEALVGYLKAQPGPLTPPGVNRVRALP